MNKRLTLTIGIPAYNEQHNIGLLLTQICQATNDYYRLEKILVISDGSSDATITEVKRVKSPYIQIMNGKSRKGKPYRINQIFSLSSSDITLILDADLSLKDPHAIDRIIHPFISNPLVALTSGWAIPLPANSLTQKIASVNVHMWRKAVSFNKNADLYYSSGSICAFSRNLYKNLLFHNYSADDAFSYIACREKGLLFQKILNTGLYFSLPSNWNEYIRQWVRFIQSQEITNSIFSPEITKKYYTLGYKEKLFAYIWSTAANPFWTFLYLLSRIWIELSYRMNKTNSSLWAIATSTK